MTFVHDDPEFAQLLAIVAREVGIAAALVEKDYWVTHCLWALHQTGLDLWFKGGTSLSKGFGLIERFSEDLDLMVQHGSVESLPPVPSWTSLNKGPVEKRRAFYRALAAAFTIPGVEVEFDTTRQDKHARGADYIGRYPGVLDEAPPPAMSPFVRFEVGRARVVPFVEMPLSSFVHEHLERQALMGGYLDNRPRAVRCVHPLVTLLEKLDAMARRYAGHVRAVDHRRAGEELRLAVSVEVTGRHLVAEAPALHGPGERRHGDVPDPMFAVGRIGQDGDLAHVISGFPAHHQVGHTVPVEVVTREDPELHEVAAVGTIHGAGIPLVVRAQQRVSNRYTVPPRA
jgi:hypothetical protein